MAILSDLNVEFGPVIPHIGTKALIQMTWAIVVIVLITIAVIWIINRRRYKYGVVLYKKRGDILIPSIRHKARLKNMKDGVQQLYIPSIKRTIRVPDDKYIAPSDDRRFHQGVLFLRKIDEETYTPILTIAKEDGISLIPHANDVDGFHDAVNSGQSMILAEGWVSRNLPMLIMAGTSITLAAAVIIFAILSSDSSQLQAQASQKIAEAINQLNQANVPLGGL